MLCQFLLYNKVNQLYVYIYPRIPFLFSLLPTLLIPPLQVVQSMELISLCYAAASHQPSTLHLVVYTCPCYSLTSSQLPSPHPPTRVLKSILYVCVFIPALPLGSSVLFFQIPYMIVFLNHLMLQPAQRSSVVGYIRCSQ